jgi:hypothetical protein
LVRAGKNEATNGARMGNIKIKVEFSLRVSVWLLVAMEMGRRTSLSLSYLVPVPRTNRGEQQGENQIQKKIRASTEGS